MSDENEAPEPNAVSQGETAQAGESKKADADADAALQAFSEPDYEEMNKNISETRKQAGPPLLEDDDGADALAQPEEEEEDIKPTDPS